MTPGGEGVSDEVPAAPKDGALHTWPRGNDTMTMTIYLDNYSVNVLYQNSREPILLPPVLHPKFLLPGAWSSPKGVGDKNRVETEDLRVR